ncbi:unknown similar to AMEV137 [Mythimna separata entomopoxvirus 'L']|uniref:Uncharacterized protein n=1 Tax=Mythimna separata entomopoxvirus 'L' TaxID=1293572 RepID=A0A916KQA9_9POXV|nr:unknown similar to AMEV137 [Mythimna separata entomopoxvirus 'L']CCU56377.1 unknown similar to AMEV137 [Mythimna separata entomopoxvirus 'L']
MIFIYILLFFLVIFIFAYIVFLFYIYNISFLPKFIPEEVVRQGEGLDDISQFIRIREEINEYIYNIDVLTLNTANIRQEISRLENTIEIQQLTINTLKDELNSIEGALEDQINLETSKVDLEGILVPLYVLLETNTIIKIYIYINIREFMYKFIYTSVLLNATRNSVIITPVKPLLTNLFVTIDYISNVTNYINNRVRNDINNIIIVSYLRSIVLNNDL